MDKLLAIIKKIIPVKIFNFLQPFYHYSLNLLAAAFYRWPSNKLIVIGITGTTGKTTSVYLIAKTLEGAGYKVGYTSTAMFNDGEREWLNDKKMTMVGRFFTQRMLNRMVKNKCQYAIVETTSEGILQYRHRFINYDILVFTGLYPEHIERHGSFENYKAAKAKLFEHLKGCKTKYVDDQKRVHLTDASMKKLDLDRVKKTIIANMDDEHAEFFLGFWAERKMGYRLAEGGWSIQPDVAKNLELVLYKDIIISGSGTSFTILDKPVNLKLLGAFNATNAMNAVCVGLNQEMSLETAIKSLEEIEGVAGRLERIDEGQPYAVIVDYAYEPHAIEKLYETLKVIPHNKIIHVLGSAGGGRDASRRPVLGKLAGTNADHVIVTDEDPYDEDPQLIIDQVAVGAEYAGKRFGDNLHKILDRREAIIKALDLAEEEDIVLITGKGSEQAICVADGEKLTWDDRAVIRGILSGKK